MHVWHNNIVNLSLKVTLLIFVSIIYKTKVFWGIKSTQQQNGRLEKTNHGNTCVDCTSLIADAEYTGTHL